MTFCENVMRQAVGSPSAAAAEAKAAARATSPEAASSNESSDAGADMEKADTRAETGGAVNDLMPSSTAAAAAAASTAAASTAEGAGEGAGEGGGSSAKLEPSAVSGGGGAPSSGDTEAEDLRDATNAAARALVAADLASFLGANPDGTFVGWIASLHPENVHLDRCAPTPLPPPPPPPCSCSGGTAQVGCSGGVV